MISWTLDNAEENAAAFPLTFSIPPRSKREALVQGNVVKLIYRFQSDDQASVERMWVIVTKRHEDRYLGILDNNPTSTQELQAGLETEFGPEHVIAIWTDDDDGTLPNQSTDPVP